MHRIKPVFVVAYTTAVTLTLSADSLPLDLKFVPERVVSASASSSSQPVFQSQFISSDEGPPSVHAGTLTRLSDGGVMAAWFGGTREGAKDVCIYSSIRGPDGRWSEQKVIASREQTTDELNRYIRKLGNPVLKTDKRGRIWLFYVTVSVGGWSGSSVTSRFSDDSGKTWSAARRLNCTPFLNISTLVKGTPLETDTGHLLVPVYHEFLNKFAELLVLDPDGNLVDKYRLNADGGSLQPCLMPRNERQAFVFCRQYGKPEELVLANEFDLASGEWQPVQQTNVRNPNAALTSVRRWNGQLMMVSNSGVGRERLTLAVSDDGLDWKEIKDIETGVEGDEFSYPYLIRGAEIGTYDLIYTWQRQRMKTLTFNDTWLEMSE